MFICEDDVQDATKMHREVTSRFCDVGKNSKQTFILSTAFNGVSVLLRKWFQKVNLRGPEKKRRAENNRESDFRRWAKVLI